MTDASPPPTTPLPSPTVTVITPAFNVEKFLDDAARSVLQQSFADFEYLIVNDGSTDGTSAIIERVARSDQRVRLIRHDTRLGLSAARNSGLREARGRYVAFLDGDDLWEPEFLARAQHELECAGPGNAGVFAWSIFMSEDGRPLPSGSFPDAREYDFVDVLRYGSVPDNGSCLLIKKECFDQVGAFHEDLLVGADTEMWLRILSRSSFSRMRCLDEALVRRRLRQGALTDRYRSETDERLRSLQYRYATYLPLLSAEQARAVLLTQFILLLSARGFPVRRLTWLRDLIRTQRPGATGSVERALPAMARLPMPALRLASRGLRTYLQLQRLAGFLRRRRHARAGTHGGLASAITMTQLFGQAVAVYSPGRFSFTDRAVRFLNSQRASLRRRLSDGALWSRLSRTRLGAAMRRLADKALPYD